MASKLLPRGSSRAHGSWILAALVATAAALLASPPAQAQDRPLQTEPATTSTAGSLVFETGFDLIRNEPNYVTGVQRTAWAGPLLRLVYSPASTVELDVEWLARVGTLGEEGRGDVASSDFGDVTLRAKLRLRDGGAHGTTLGARFGVTLPETSFDDERFRPLGLGPNTLRAFAQVLLTRPLGRARADVDLGLYLADEVYRPHDQRDLLSYALALELPVGRGGLTAVAELAGRTGEGAPGTEERSEARAGVRLRTGRTRWDLALRRGLAEADGDWGFTAGLAVTLRQR